MRGQFEMKSNRWIGSKERESRQASEKEAEPLPGISATRNDILLRSGQIHEVETSNIFLSACTQYVACLLYIDVLNGRNSFSPFLRSFPD
jgi:hypothetical protein